MKVLIAYTTGTGNTEKIAGAILGGVEASHDAEIKRLEDVRAEDVKAFDLVFLGSPIHAGGLSAAAGEFLNALPDSPGFRLAGFVTHASGVYERKEGFDRGINAFSDAAKAKGIEYLGCFDCRGRLDPNIRPMVQQAKKIPDDEWAKRMEKLDKHPDEEDERAAEDFAREVVSKVR
ncbi:MAG: hypothetical protein JW984_02200 [Deltaproteobacteria bacterium]|uniref:Flavodoxin-like domain-containing protein n=1 Tax=Candidatus Zymogenus saltonus TaxID=2844893 RepID=A0A9D8KCH7_9DELT|nr:hypothetical protein [Candidatus Zymogenus saltonus]